jgi:hypothetical protein
VNVKIPFAKNGGFSDKKNTPRRRVETFVRRHVGAGGGQQQGSWSCLVTRAHPPFQSTPRIIRKP